MFTVRQERWLARLILIARAREALGPFAWRLLVATPYATVVVIAGPQPMSLFSSLLGLK